MIVREHLLDIFPLAPLTRFFQQPGSLRSERFPGAKSEERGFRRFARAKNAPFINL